MYLVHPNEDDMMETHKKIKFIRMFKGWSQEKMAEKLQMALNGYAKIESGKVDINLSRLQQIADTLEVELTQLIGLNEKSIFNFIENNSTINQQTDDNIDQSKCMHELEKAQLIIMQKDSEIRYLNEIIELMKKNKT